MSLTPGTRLGAYEIVALLGAGGMGEVYRARDTRLDRTVAIKVLPADVASTREMRDRFEREARTVAALNHPHICTLHDVGRHEDVDFLVMEYLEGETLQHRLEQGALPMDQALQIAVQVADALATAHRAGVVHRDLKPGNIFLVGKSSEGRRGGPSGPPLAKLLDFGLAKPAGPMAAGSASMLPTTPRGLTVQGTILGTFQYMAPEQLEGLEADARTDIFAFGAMLYEMLTGRKAFDGRSHASLIAAILEHDPAPLSAIQPGVPQQIEHVVTRCLTKSPDDRWQTAADLHRELQWAANSIDHAAPPGAPRPPRVALWQRPITLGLAAAAALVLTLLAGVVQWMLPRPALAAGAHVARLTMVLPVDHQLQSAFPGVAISPAGTHVAYVARRAGQQQLYLRAIDGIDTRALAGTEAAASPFFSPDGRWIGFFAQGKLKRVSVTTGSTQTLCDAPFAGGGSWGEDGTIYFAATNVSGISKVPENGGTPSDVTRLDRARGEISHRGPQALPGGGAVLFTVWTGPSRDEQHVHVQRLDTGERTSVVQGGGTGRYVPTGHVVYTRGDELLAIPFDLERLVTSGQAVRLTDVVQGAGTGEGADFAVSDTGVLVHPPGDPQRLERRLVWVDRSGRVEPLAAPPRSYSGNAALSPDGRRAAVDIEGVPIGIWIHDFLRGTLTPLATGSGASQAPRWTPDGRRVVYRGTRTGFRNVWSKSVDDAAGEERLTSGETLQTPGSWSVDGQWLVYHSTDPATGFDIWALPTGGDRKPRVIVNTRFDEMYPRLSPDGRWLAYASNEPGRFEAFVQPFSGPGTRVQISTDGGVEPVWSRNGRELFYRNGERMMAVEVTMGSAFKAGTSRVLFEGRFIFSPNGAAAYDLAADGRFLMIQRVHPDPPTNQIQVVLNWFQELRSIGN